MFDDRAHGGRSLADRLLEQEAMLGLTTAADDVVVVGLPRGGVPVAREVANTLDAALDVIVVRKLGVPSQPEVAMGAIGEHGVLVRNEAVVASAGVDDEAFDRVAEHEAVELGRRLERFRPGRAGIDLAGRTAVVVDDGVATGSTAAAACAVARAAGASRVILAVPVAPRDWIERLGDTADHYVAVETPPNFVSVGQHYNHFGQVSDAHVRSCLFSDS